jgi:hypothetical protein
VPPQGVWAAPPAHCQIGRLAGGLGWLAHRACTHAVATGGGRQVVSNTLRLGKVLLLSPPLPPPRFFDPSLPRDHLCHINPWLPDGFHIAPFPSLLSGGPGENEACVRYVLDRYGSSFKLVPAGPPFLGAPGLCGQHPTMMEAGRMTRGAATATASADATAGLDVGNPATAADSRGEGAAAATAAAEVGTPLTGPRPAGEASLPAAVAEAAESQSELGEEWLTEAEAALVQRFDPSDPDLDTIGFFVAKFVKVGPVPPPQER